MAQEMTPLERVSATIRHEEPDRVPMAPLAWAAAGKTMFGYKISEYVMSPEKMARAQLAFRREFGFDIMWVGSDVYYLAEGFGSRIRILEDGIPVLEKPLMNSLEDADKLEKPDPLTDGRMPIVLKCIEILSESSKVPIGAIGGQASWSCALQLLGFEKFVLEAAKADANLPGARPDLIHKVLKTATEAYIDWQKAQIDAGCHIARISDSSASIDVTSPSIYRKFIHPYHCEIVKALKKYASDIPIAKHTCGDNTKVLDLWAEEGTDWIDIDYKMDLHFVKQKIGGKVCLFGNVNPTETMLLGSPENVEREVKRCIAQAGGGGGFVLGTGCVLPENTPAANIRAFAEASRKFGKYPIKL